MTLKGIVERPTRGTVVVRRVIQTRGVALSVGRLADQVFGDPPSSVHPVALFGRAMDALASFGWADTRLRGMVLCSVGLGLTGLASAVLGQRGGALALSTWTTVGEAQLQNIALDICDLLRQGDLDAARRRCGEIVGRDTRELGTSEICRAVVESLAENTADGVLGPLLAGFVYGPRGALCYRAINTMDAMFGHHNPEFENFGWFAARLDDVVNLPVARVGALLVALRCSPEQRRALRRAWSSARAHPSPNAGVIEAAFAVRLGVTLGGRNTYGDRVEERVLLGNGPSPVPDDIENAVEVSRRLTRDCLALLACVEVVVGMLRGRRRKVESRRRRDDRGVQ